MPAHLYKIPPVSVPILRVTVLVVKSVSAENEVKVLLVQLDVTVTCTHTCVHVYIHVTCSEFDMLVCCCHKLGKKGNGSHYLIFLRSPFKDI